jgi:hypothetical protein
MENEPAEVEQRIEQTAVSPANDSPIQSENVDDKQMNDIVQSVLDRLMKQDRDLEKMELKCRAYEKIMRDNKIRIKSHSNNIDEPQTPKEDQTNQFTDRTPIAVPGKRYILKK